MSVNEVKILVSDKLSQDGVKILQDTPGFTVDVKVGLSPEELQKIIPEYDGLIIRSATTANQQLLEAATNLKVIG
ncbi:MAG: phosphoglycerate dehydrogenase, partial [Nitrospinota bacterium]|nr:phosphoglycerate dehydrogenase [Nitrospinota bacterium]